MNKENTIPRQPTAASSSIVINASIKLDLVTSITNKFESNDSTNNDINKCFYQDSLSVSSGSTSIDSLSSLDFVSHIDIIAKERNQFVLDTKQKVKIPKDFNLLEFIAAGKKATIDLLQKKENELKQKLKNNINNIDTETYVENKVVIETELQLVRRFGMVFNKEMVRLYSIKEDMKVIKAALEREFQRATKMLPIYGYKNDILESLEDNDIIVLIGATGSGKSTQIPQFLLEAGYFGRRKIVCTQPRKVAATSLAKRVTEEFNCLSSPFIKSKDHFKRLSREDKGKNKLIFMTDRSLLNEYQKDNLLKQYSCIIIDDAHERSLFTDILLCKLKELIKKRRESGNILKLIVTSATLDENLFTTYFNNCPSISVPGQIYPVKIYWEKSSPNYEKQALQKVQNVITNRSKSENGDILVFLTSPDEVEKAIHSCKKMLIVTKLEKKYEVFALHGKLSVEAQVKIFEPSQDNKRKKIIFSTNIAETSVTIDGVTTVIDTGRAKERVYNQNRNISILKVNFISQSSAIQRKGRAGRTAPGEVFRLYEENDFQQMDLSQPPEILRVHLGVVILQLLRSGVKDVLNYDLIEKPSKENMLKAIKKLEDLQLMKNNKITKLGRKAADLYLEPSIARMIIEGIQLGISEEVVQIASMLTVSHILYKKAADKDEKDMTNASKIMNAQKEGDFISLMKLYREFVSKKFKEKKSWCDNLNLNITAFGLASRTFIELKSSIKQYTKNEKKAKDENKNELILKAICSGFHSNLAYYNGKLKDNTIIYKLIDLNQEACVHNSSVVSTFEEGIELVLFNELMRTDKLYIKNITPIKSEWIKNYTKYDLDSIKRNIKKKFTISTTHSVIKGFKARENELLEVLEEQIGYIVQLGKKEIIIEIPEEDNDRCKQIVHNYINIILDRIKKEIYEFKPKRQYNTRVLLQKGFKVYNILLSNQYIRLNFKASNLISEYDLKLLFSQYGTLLDFRKFSSKSSKTQGYVIYSKPNQAFKAYNSLSSIIMTDEPLTLYPAVSLDGKEIMDSLPILYAQWFTTKSQRIAFIDFETEEDLIETTEMLRYDKTLEGAKFELKKGSKITLCIKNLKPDIDEYILSKLLLTIAGVKKITVLREKLNNDIFNFENENLLYTQLHSLFTCIGKVEINIFPESFNNYGKGKATIEFETINDMNKAIEKYHEKSGVFGEGLLHLTYDPTEEIKVPKLVYDKLQTELSNLRNYCKVRLGCIVQTKSLQNEFMIIKLKSDNLERLVLARNVFEESFKPLIISLPYYQFRQLKKKEFELRRATEKLGCFLILDVKTKQVKLYGKEKEKSKALILQFKDSTQTKCIVKVKTLKCIIGDNMSTYKKLKEEFKGDIQINMKEKSIILQSQPVEFHTFEKKIKELETNYLEKNHNQCHKKDCELCWGELQNPFTLICSHEFCKSCLGLNFESLDIEKTLCCPSCESELCISDISEIINDENLLEEKSTIALNRFILSNKDKFRFCHKCGQICEIIEDNRFDCPVCKKNYCVLCEKSHSGNRKCGEDEENERLFSEFLKNNTKPCPKCDNPIEKNSGCNHITCKCGAHFCWECLFLGKNSKEVYEHLNKVHGTIGI
ncbi:hypothetical protein ABK040_005988 [Willaertia magna]